MTVQHAALLHIGTKTDTMLSIERSSKRSSLVGKSLITCPGEVNSGGKERYSHLVVGCIRYQRARGVLHERDWSTARTRRCILDISTQLYYKSEGTYQHKRDASRRTCTTVLVKAMARFKGYNACGQPRSSTLSRKPNHTWSTNGCTPKMAIISSRI